MQNNTNGPKQIRPDLIRRDFPLLEGNPLAYLDNAATTQKPSQVLDRMRAFYETENANPLRGLYDLGVRATQAYENARAHVAAFIGAASADQIVFTRNTTESMNLLAYSYGLSHIGPGDEILVSIAEHHSNMLPWRMVAQKTGARLSYLEPDSFGAYSEQELETKIRKGVKLVAIAQVSNVFGRLNPIGEIIRRAHAVGAVVVVDAAQSAPHMRIDVARMDADFLAFSGHKMLAPMGIGVLYGKAELLADMPPFMQGGEMIDSVTKEKVVYSPVPHRFEAGTVSAADAAGLDAAMTYLENLGFDAIAQRERELSARAYEQLSRIPHLRLFGSTDPTDHHGIFTFVLDQVHPHDVSTILDSEGIAVRAGHHCAQPLMRHLHVFSTTRASLYFYNTEEEVDRLCSTLATVRRRMGFGDE